MVPSPGRPDVASKLALLDALAQVRVLDENLADTWFAWVGPSAGIVCLICGRSMRGLPTPSPHAVEHLAAIGPERVAAIEALVAVMQHGRRTPLMTDRSIYRAAIREVLGDPVPPAFLLK